MTEQDRAEFEAWAKSMRLNVKRSAYDGSFWKREAKYAYLAWHAARRTQDAQVRELVEAVLNMAEMGRSEGQEVIVDAKVFDNLQALAQLKETSNE